MNGALSWMPLETGRDLGWTLIHFLWQGLLLAALLNAVLPFCRSAVARHNCAFVTLVLMALAPIATFLFLHDSGKSGTADIPAAGALAPAWIPAPRMDWLVMLWLGGVAVLSLRALGGWYLTQSLVRRDTSAVPPALLRRCHQLQRRLAVTWPVRFLLSSRTKAPLVIGCLRPVILIPVSAISGLSPQQLDALILHELAHIRRLDTLTNILLAAVETILFYHPVTWWVSRQVRTEREHCCDDFAVSACGDAALYVEALASLEEWKVARGLLLTERLAANGGRLKDRVARLLDMPVQSRRLSPTAITGLALLGLLAVSAAIAAPSGKDMTALKPIQETHMLPPYPAESKQLKEEGAVLLEVTIGTDGSVSRSRVVRPSGHQRLDAAAANFVQGYWRWQPAIRAGKPVATTTRVSVLFKLAPKAK
jgi:TonB family protein